jgi:hypothetical protein
MRGIRRFACRPTEVLFLAWVAAAGCSSGAPPAGDDPSGGEGGDAVMPGAGGARSGGAGGRASSSGGSGGGAVMPDASTGMMPDEGTGTAPDEGTGTAPDEGTATQPDASSVAVDSLTPMATDGGPQPSYAGEIPIYYGPEVGPIVQMNCPEDPTTGWTEYKDSFTVQRPYTVPINTRFSITGGIYNLWVFPNDSPHSPSAHGRNPRTEARYGGTADAATGNNFKTGMRLYSADMLIERNAVGSAIMQIHTTADGGGPIGIRMQSNGDIVNNGSLTVVKGSNIPGGLVDKWFNYKASLNADTLEVKIYINNCLQSTYKGDRGDGNFYFKNGVYFCKTSKDGCFSHYKNIHLYKK